MGHNTGLKNLGIIIRDQWHQARAGEGHEDLKHICAFAPPRKPGPGWEPDGRVSGLVEEAVKDRRGRLAQGKIPYIRDCFPAGKKDSGFGFPRRFPRPHRCLAR